jgi:hypothetical protein
MLGLSKNSSQLTVFEQSVHAKSTTVVFGLIHAKLQRFGVYGDFRTGLG